MADGVLRSAADLAAIAARVQAPTNLGGFVQPKNAVLLSAPFSFGVDSSDFLRVRLWTKAVRAWPSAQRTFELIVRMVRLDGTGQVSAIDTFAPTDLVGSTTYVTLEPGAIQTISLSWAGDPMTTLNGPTYAMVDLLRGSPEGAQKVIGTLVAGYAGPGQPLTWPGTLITGPMDGPGYAQVIQYSALAGAEISIPCGAGEVLRIRSITTELTTAVAAVNRRTRLQFSVNAVPGGLLSSPQDVGGGAVCQTTWMPGASLTAGLATADGVAPMPAGTVLRQGDAMKTNTIGLQAGDRYTKFLVAQDVYLETLT